MGPRIDYAGFKYDILTVNKLCIMPMHTIVLYYIHMYAIYGWVLCIDLTLASGPRVQGYFRLYTTLHIIVW